MAVYYVIYPNKTVKEVMADFAKETKHSVGFFVRNREIDEDIPVFTIMLKHITLWSKKQ
jgi:hypothetical protein